MVTDTATARGRPVVEVVASAVAGGARAVLVRDKALSSGDRLRLVRAVRRLLDPVGGVLLVASDVDIAAASGADGVHLAATDPLPPPGAFALVGRSCHSPSDLAAAAAEGCDYALLSPIYPTASKPGYGPALGPAALAGAALPVWALGGVTTAERASACRAAGASGVAVMGSIMGAGDPAGVVAALSRQVNLG